MRLLSIMITEFPTDRPGRRGVEWIGMWWWYKFKGGYEAIPGAAALRSLLL